MKKKLVITILCALSANATLDAAQYDQLKQAISIAPHQVRLALNTLRLESIHNPGLTENLQKKIDETSKQTLAKRTCAAYADIRQQNLKLAQLESSSDIKAIQDKILTVFTKDEQNEVGLRFNEINASQGCLGYISRKTEEGIQDNLRAVNNLLESGLAGRKSIDTASIIEAYAAFNALDATFLKQAERSSLSVSALSGFAGFCLAGLMVMSYYLYMMDHVSNPAPTQGVEEFGNCIETAGQTRINMASILSSCANAVGVNLGQIATTFVGAYLFSNASENKLTTLADNAMTTNTAAQRQLSIAATDLANATKILNSTACSQTAKREFAELAATTAAPTNATGPAHNAVMNATHNMQNATLTLKTLNPTWQQLISKLPSLTLMLSPTKIIQYIETALNISAGNLANVTITYNASISNNFTQTQTAALTTSAGLVSSLGQTVQTLDTSFSIAYPTGVATSFINAATQCFTQVAQNYVNSVTVPATTAASLVNYTSCLLNAQTEATTQSPSSQQLSSINQYVMQMINTTNPDVIFSNLTHSQDVYLDTMRQVYNAFVNAMLASVYNATLNLNAFLSTYCSVPNPVLTFLLPASTEFNTSMKSLNATEVLKQNTLNVTTRQVARALDIYSNNISSLMTSVNNCPFSTGFTSQFPFYLANCFNAFSNVSALTSCFNTSLNATSSLLISSSIKPLLPAITSTSNAILEDFVTFFNAYMNNVTAYLKETLTQTNELNNGVLQATFNFIGNE